MFYGAGVVGVSPDEKKKEKKEGEDEKKRRMSARRLNQSSESALNSELPQIEL